MAREKSLQLDDLPNELLLAILSHCDKRQLEDLCLLSYRFYRLCKPLTYRHYHPDLWTDVVDLYKSIKHGLGPAKGEEKAVAESCIAQIEEMVISFWQMEERAPRLGDHIKARMEKALPRLASKMSSLRCVRDAERYEHVPPD